MAGTKKAATSTQKPATTKASAKPTKKVASRSTTAKTSGSKKPTAKSPKESKCTKVTDIVETMIDLTLSSEVPSSPVENGMYKLNRSVYLTFYLCIRIVFLNVSDFIKLSQNT